MLSTENDVKLEEDRRATCCTSTKQDEQFEEGEDEVETDAQRKPLLGVAKCYTSRTLGGPKRCHLDQKAGPSSSHCKDEKGAKTTHKVLRFDLNKLPTEKDEDRK
ncbi:hypothetical protein BUALT_Bualt13G0045900 [Buddleja alternifolia]|uniref:Uncharacterized protein n=1 Tax=Buddleja alternifolia TaxID=168488 RepID=A0AAV6WLI7_9LAMI|nr:hypothetical protein BUALT_Bualt13G0045900 [Buddleja alternifolia]